MNLISIKVHRRRLKQPSIIDYRCELYKINWVILTKKFNYIELNKLMIIIVKNQKLNNWSLSFSETSSLPTNKQQCHSDTNLGPNQAPQSTYHIYDPGIELSSGLEQFSNIYWSNCLHERWVLLIHSDVGGGALDLTNLTKYAIYILHLNLVKWWKGVR